jgi:hypothetical protein
VRDRLYLVEEGAGGGVSLFVEERYEYIYH